MKRFVGIHGLVAASFLAVAGLATGCVDDFGNTFKVAPVPIEPDGVEPAGLPSAASGAIKAPVARPVAESVNSWTAGHAMVSSGGRLYIADRERNKLVVMRQQPLQVVQTIDVANRPEKLVAGPDGSVWVAPRTGTAVLKFAATGTPEQPLATKPTVVEVGLEPRALAMSANGDQLFVALGGARTLVVLNTKTNQEVSRQTLSGGPTALAAAPSYLTVTYDNGTLERFQPAAANAPLKTMGNSPQTSGASLVSGCKDSNRKSRRFLGAAYEPATDEVLAARVIAAPGTPADFAASQLKDNGKNSGGGGYGGGTKTDCTEPRRPIEPSVLALSASSKAPRELSGLPVRLTTPGNTEQTKNIQTSGDAFASRFDQPADVSIHPTRRLLAMPATGTDNVLLLHTGDKVGANEGVEAGELVTGHAPIAVAFSDDGRFAYVLDSQEVKVSAFDLGGWLNGDKTFAAMPTFKATTRTAYGEDILPEAARLGRRTFTFAGNSRLSKDGIFACATCHFDGGEDKLVWITPDGARQTPQLSGRLEGTAPFNWKGSEVELQSNMVKTVKRMHGEGLTKDELASLEQFLLVGLTPAAPNPNLAADGVLNAKQAHGKEIFEGSVASCSSCHVGGTGVDGIGHNVGTGTKIDEQAALFQGDNTGDFGKFDTPTLKGLWNTAPYLHDGSAPDLPSLLARLGTSMGHAAKLTATEKVDLIEYLKTL